MPEKEVQVRAAEKAEVLTKAAAELASPPKPAEPSTNELPLAQAGPVGPVPIERPDSAATPPAEEGTAASEAAEAEESQCFGCGKSVPSSELRQHLESSEKCLSTAWQAAVNAVGCMPGASTTLWCPACPDAFLGKWTGSVSKAPALLRHAASASKAGLKESAPKAHAWLLKAFVDLVLVAPPPPLADSEGVEVEEAVAEMQLQEWISNSPPLMGVVGPLLAKPGPEAREAVRQELEGSSSSQAPVPFGMAGIDAPQPVEAKGKKKKAKKAQGPDVPGYDLYNEDIPMDVFMACEDHTRRTADGVPVLDLLSSDEDQDLTQL